VTADTRVQISTPLTTIYLFVSLLYSVIIEGKERCYFETSNKFAALENLDAEGDNNL
jgi:hypothetical protein